MRTRPVLVALGLALMVALAAATTPASAQEGDATLVVDQAHPAPGSTHYFVILEADGTPVDDAEVTATPVDPDGNEGDPVVLSPAGDGVYQGVVLMDTPGEWTVEFASTDPEASAEHVQEMTASGTPSPGTGESDDGNGAAPFVLIIVAVAAVLVLGAVVYVVVDRMQPAADGDGIAQSDDGSSSDATPGGVGDDTNAKNDAGPDDADGSVNG